MFTVSVVSFLANELQSNNESGKVKRESVTETGQKHGLDKKSNYISWIVRMQLGEGDKANTV